MNSKNKRIAWGITGSGHFLKESMEIINSLDNIDLFLSKAGEEVLKWYGYKLSDLKKKKIKVFKDVTAGSAPVSLFYEDAPLTVANFVNLSKRGYYNNLLFHRVINDFMIQGGCPNGTGTGGPGYQFNDEFHPERKHDKPGILSMANAGPGTNGSQFFITHIETPWLDNNHTVFGEIINSDDQAIVNQIIQGDSIKDIKIVGNLPKDEEINKQIESWNIILEQNNY